MAIKERITGALSRGFRVWLDIWRKALDYKSAETAKNWTVGVGVQLAALFLAAIVLGVMGCFVTAILLMFATCAPVAALSVRFAAGFGKSKWLGLAAMPVYLLAAWIVTAFTMDAVDSGTSSSTYSVGGTESGYTPGPSRFERLRAKAEAGDADAQCEVARCYIEADGVGRDYAKARTWLGLAVAQKHSVAMANLGRMHYEGLGGDKDFAKAAELLGKAAEAGVADAMWRIGNMHLLGDGVPQDERKGARYIETAAEKGVFEAQREISAMYLAGRGVGRDVSKACKWLEKVADKDSDARWDLAVMLDNVIGNPAAAEKWYSKCTYGQHGAEACFRLGMMYAQGEGVRRSMSVACSWFEKAADKGDADAMYNLGAMYATGNNGECDPDERKAKKWLEKAAKLGHPQAQSLLSELD